MHEVIEAFRQAPSNAERGIKFEKLMVRHFELDPMLANTYDRVWRWADQQQPPAHHRHHDQLPGDPLLTPADPRIEAKRCDPLRGRVRPGWQAALV